MSVRDNQMINQNTDDEAKKILDALGDGVAREDTAQEILEEVKSGNAGKGIITHGGTYKSSSSGTALEVTGSGNLLWAAFDHSVVKNGTCEFIVEIDGEVVVNGEVTNTDSSNNEAIIAVFHPIHGVWENSGSSYTFLVGGDIKITGTLQYYTYAQSHVVNIGESKAVSNNDAVSILYLIEQQGLRFNESLKVTYKNTANSSEIVVGYTLDE